MERTRMERLANLLLAGCDRTRSGVLLTLRTGPMTAGELGKKAGCSQCAMSHHLRTLRISGLVDYTKVGRHWHYSLSEDGRRFVAFFEAIGA